jgi:hypothetical protein
MVDLLQALPLATALGVLAYFAAGDRQPIAEPQQPAPRVRSPRPRGLRFIDYYSRGLAPPPGAARPARSAFTRPWFG